MPEQAPEDGGMAGEAADKETDSSLATLAHPEMGHDCGLARCYCGGLVSCWRACGGGWTCVAAQNRLTDL